MEVQRSDVIPFSVLGALPTTDTHTSSRTAHIYLHMHTCPIAGRSLRCYEDPASALPTGGSEYCLALIPHLEHSSVLTNVIRMHKKAG